MDANVTNKIHLKSASIIVAVMLLLMTIASACSPSGNNAGENTGTSPEVSSSAEVSGSPNISGEPSQNNELSSVPPENTIRVGMECAYAPFNWTQQDDSNGAVPIVGGGFANGYDVQIAKEIAKSLGKELVIVKVEWDGLVPALNADMIDAIIAGMSPTAERKEAVDFSDGYYKSDLVVVVKKDSKYASAKSLADLKGMKLTGQLNTFHYTVIEQIDGVDKQTAMKNFSAMIVAVSSGIVDGYVSERPGALSAELTNPDLTFISFDQGKGFNYSDDDVSIAVGLKKGSALTSEINSALKNISQETRDSIMSDAVKNQPATE